MDIEIIPYNPALAPVFRELTLDWINTYFEVEAKDLEVINDCKASIIDKGGYVFFAKCGEQIAGCFALIALKGNSYELGKMAVAPSFQGKKIGQKMLSFAIDIAQREGWDSIILYSNTALEKALHIYRKYGFKEVEMEKNTDYKRSNIKMELKLQPEGTKANRNITNNLETWEKQSSTH